MDYNNARGIEFREVEETTHNGQAARVVAGSRVYATDVADLWDAITNAERLPRWFSAVSGEFELGGRYQIEGNAGGEITRCDEPHALDVSWEYAGNVSWVNVKLEPDGDRTKLTLQHITPKDAASEAFWKQYGPGATGVGWDLGFLGLGLHLESGGKPIDKEKNEAWMSSHVGKIFIRACASDWGKAHTASGELKDTAQKMAEATAKFYTGE